MRSVDFIVVVSLGWVTIADSLRRRARGPRVTELPSGTVTFLFSDLEGSTRLWEEHPKGMRTGFPAASPASTAA